MKQSHSKIRAEQRYNIIHFNDRNVLSDILEDKCLLIESDRSKYSHIFLVRYKNRYIRVVTDFDINFIKTVLPLKNDLDLVEKLNSKLIA